MSPRSTSCLESRSHNTMPKMESPAASDGGAPKSDPVGGLIDSNNSSTGPGSQGLRVYFDGACEPVNPGGTMGFGVVIFDGDSQVWACSGRSRPADGPGQTSSNLAEYAALLCALDWLLDNNHRDHEIEICGDSKLVIEQMAGRWQIGRGHYVKAA